MHHTRRFGKSILPDLRGKINQEVFRLNTLAINGQDITIAAQNKILKIS
nr:MAG TPA: hypothetical protein [Caudoviricetes sp.]